MNAVHRAASAEYGLVKLTADHPRYPPALREASGRFPAISAAGNLEILETGKLALFCSARCPGNLIVQAYDLALALRDAGVTVIGGFHTPVEQECARVLLRGSQPLIICPARSIEGIRIPSEWRGPLEQGRLLLLCPIEMRNRRATVETAVARNQLVGAIADAVLVVHAAPGSRTEALSRTLLMQARPVFTLDGVENAGLVAAGAWPVRPPSVQEYLRNRGWPNLA